MDKDIPKIDCTTVTTWRNKKTSEVFKEQKAGPAIVQAVTVTVSTKGLEKYQKVMTTDTTNTRNTTEHIVTI